MLLYMKCLLLGVGRAYLDLQSAPTSCPSPKIKGPLYSTFDFMGYFGSSGRAKKDGRVLVATFGGLVGGSGCRLHLGLVAVHWEQL